MTRRRHFTLELAEPRAPSNYGIDGARTRPDELPLLRGIHDEVALVVNEYEARGPLASGIYENVTDDTPDVNAQLGHALLLRAAFRSRRAPESYRLELRLLDGEVSYLAWIVRADYERGQAFEGLNDMKAACIPYRHVVDRWRTATPHCTTAEAAGARWRTLRCPPLGN